MRPRGNIISESEIDILGKSTSITLLSYRARYQSLCVLCVLLQDTVSHGFPKLHKRNIPLRRWLWESKVQNPSTGGLRVYADGVEQLGCIMKEHFIHVAPTNLALEPRKKIIHLRIHTHNNSHVQFSTPCLQVCIDTQLSWYLIQAQAKLASSYYLIQILYQ